MKLLRSLLCIAGCFYLLPVWAQTPGYSTANAHSHNDYVQEKPFFLAYKNQFGSIETDIHLTGGMLLVSHDSAYLLKTSTLENMYLVPLSKAIEKNGGYVYSDTNRILQLVIDLKTDATATLDALVKLLHKFPLIIHNPVVRIVITGNRPADSLFISYPAYIWFDGRLDRDYSKEALCRIAMLSADFKNYSRWEGNDTLPPFDKKVFSLLVKKAHLLKKPIRFWACPDGPGAWEELIRLNVDYINTDHIIALSRYLSQLN